jgi:hypothetical protein
MSDPFVLLWTRWGFSNDIKSHVIFCIYKWFVIPSYVRGIHESITRFISITTTQQLLHGPFDAEIPQVRIVLSYTDKKDGDIRGVDETD